MRLVGGLLALSLVSALSLSFAVARWPGDASVEGLALRVEVERDGRTVLAETARASLPSRHTLDALRYVRLDEPFRATWEGTFYAPSDGPYTFISVSDDGSWVWVDDALVMDNGGRHGLVRRFGTIGLRRGAHALRIAYQQHGGPHHLDVRLRAPGDLSRRIHAYRQRFAPTPLTAGALAARTLHIHLPQVAVWLWFATYAIALLLVGLGVFRALERRTSDTRAGWSLALTVCAIVVAAVPGIMWGLPTELDGWAPDEVSPARLVQAMEAGFVAPWASLYPPVGFLLWAPVAMLLNASGGAAGLVAWEHPGAMHLHLAMRFLTLLMAAGVLGSAYLLTSQWSGRAAALLSVWMTGAGICFLYYAKIANVDVPYLYWLTLTLVAFSGFVRTGNLSWLRWIAVCAALAVCTKDQAAGYLVLLVPALPVIALAHHRRGNVAERLGAVIWRREWLDATLLAAAVVAIVYQGSWQTLSAHLSIVRAGRYSPMVPATLTGELQLLRLHLELLAFMASPPVLLLAGIGIVSALRRCQWSYLVTMGLPVVSYVFGFLAVLRYTYDRFLLGIALIVACLAAPVAVRLWRSRHGRTLARGALVVAAAWTVAHALTLPILMRNDTRLVVEDLLIERGDAARLVGLLAPRQYLPRLDEQPALDLGASVERLRNANPYLLLVNTAYAERLRKRVEWLPLWRGLEDGSLGYTRVVQFRSTPPWWALAWYWPYFHARSSEGLTNFDKIAPQIEVWELTAP